MKLGRSAVGSLAAALTLAILTVGVFSVLQDYGPESALRKFHRAAVNRNLRELNEVVMPNSYQENLFRLASIVDLYARSGAKYQLLYVKRENKRVIAEVAYMFPSRGRVDPVFWIVEKVPGGWRVNVNETAARLRVAYGS